MSRRVERALCAAAAVLGLLGGWNLGALLDPGFGPRSCFACWGLSAPPVEPLTQDRQVPSVGLPPAPVSTEGGRQAPASWGLAPPVPTLPAPPVPPIRATASPSWPAQIVQEATPGAAPTAVVPTPELPATTTAEPPVPSSVEPPPVATTTVEPPPSVEPTIELPPAETSAPQESVSQES